METSFITNAHNQKYKKSENKKKQDGDDMAAVVGVGAWRGRLTVGAREMWGARVGLLLAAVSAAAAVPPLPYTKINKCCERSEIMYESKCARADLVNATKWMPLFTNEDGVDNIQVAYDFVSGKPACESVTARPIYQLDNSEDILNLLPNGKLRHYIHHEQYLLTKADKELRKIPGRLKDRVEMFDDDTEHLFFDYEPGKYCMDKLIQKDSTSTSFYALVCPPTTHIDWGNTDFLMRKIFNPIFHIIGMICFLVVAIIYFVLPTLRDLTGNIVTTINICLIVSQAADIVRIFTELSSHISFLIADLILYISLLAAFFWLNSMGYYIWKTFKSRNVFLRVTDGRKYCYYTCYAWGCTFAMCFLALFAHFMLDTDNATNSITKQRMNSIITNGDQETIGWLGISVFFTPIAFTVIINIFFYLTTLKVINRMNTYGRIHHKLKHNFDMFLLLFIVMTVCWIFFLISWINHEGLMYTHIVVNALQGPLFLYICVFRQAHVVFLLRKSCCYNEPVPTNDWGDEMIQMNGSSY